MNLPDNNTIKILEERKNFLINKDQKRNNDQKNNSENSYIKAEIGALDRTLNLIKLIQNNFPDDVLIKTTTEKEINHNDTVDIEDNVLYSFDRKITEDLKLEIAFIQHNKEKQIVAVLKKYKKSMLKWAYQGKIRMTVEILKEIIEKANEIWDKD
jgi:hypothetical protein